MTTRTRTHQVRSPLPGRVRVSGWHKLTLDEVAEIRRLAAARGGWRRAVFACWAVRRHGFNHPRDRVAAQLAPARRGYLAELTNDEPARRSPAASTSTAALAPLEPLDVEPLG